jgi:ribonuclease PH
VIAGFAGRVQVSKLDANGVPNALITTASQALVAGTPRVMTFSIPATAGLGSGDYVIEIDADGDAAGAYTIGLTSP